MSVMNHSQSCFTMGVFASCSSSSCYDLNTDFFCLFIKFFTPSALLVKWDRKLTKMSSMCFENVIMMKTTWIDTLLIALPIRVGMKKVKNGIWKWPHIRPARSNSGFGIYSRRGIKTETAMQLLLLILI